MTRPKQYAHWHQYFENFSVSSLEFYKSLGSEFDNGHLPQTSLSQVDFHEGGILSSKRVYLEVQRDWLTYHICVAPFGSGFFASSRLLMSPWNTWRRIVALALGMILANILGCIMMKITTHNPNSVFIYGVTSAVILSVVFLLVLAAWIYRCLHMTYYRLDTMLAFHEAVHGRLVTRINTLLESGGRRPLSEEQAKPVMHRLLQRSL